MSRNCNHEEFVCPTVAGVSTGCPGTANTLCFELGDILIAVVLFFLFFQQDKKNH